MSPIYDLVKDRRVSIEADSAVEAARYMMEQRIGALPVLRNGELRRNGSASQSLRL